MPPCRWKSSIRVPKSTATRLQRGAGAGQAARPSRANWPGASSRRCGLAAGREGRDRRPGFINFFLKENAYQQVIAQILTPAPATAVRQSAPASACRSSSCRPIRPGRCTSARARRGVRRGGRRSAGRHRFQRAPRVLRQRPPAGRWIYSPPACGCATWNCAARNLLFRLNAYKGDYVYDIGATLHRENGDKYRHPTDKLFAGVPADEPQGGDKEKHIDALIDVARRCSVRRAIASCSISA